MQDAWNLTPMEFWTLHNWKTKDKAKAEPITPEQLQALEDRING